MAGYRFLHHWMHSVPLSPSRKQKELCIIQQIAVVNGFVISLIHSLNSYMEDTLQQPTATDHTPQIKIWTTFTYCTSLIETISSLFKHTKLHMVFYSTSTVSSLVIAKLTETANDENSAIYNLSCFTCLSLYVGQTGHSLKQIYLEHIQYIKYNNPQYFTHHTKYTWILTTPRYYDPFTVHQ